MADSDAGTDHLIHDLQARLVDRASDRTRDWWDRYLKGAADFRGVRMDHVREALDEWHDTHGLARVSPEELAGLAHLLIRQRHTEDKLAGILLFQDRLIPGGAPAWDWLIPRWAELFDEEHVADWNTCDWLCVKAIGPLASRAGEDCARAVAAWHDAPGLWRRRASVVAFVNIVRREEEMFPGFRKLVLASCEVIVADDARFAQTAVGWTLRELSHADPPAVIDFLGDHSDHMSSEAFRNATSRLPDAERERLLALRQAG